MAAAYHGTGALTYSETSLPPGLSMIATSGLVTGTLAATADVSAPYAVSVVVSDGAQSASLNFNWSVSQVVSLASVADQYNAGGEPTAGSVTSYYPWITASSAGFTENRMETWVVTDTVPLPEEPPLSFIICGFLPDLCHFGLLACFFVSCHPAITRNVCAHRPWWAPLPMA